MSQRHGARDWARARRQMTPTGNLKLIALISATVATWQQGHGASTVGRGQVRSGQVGIITQMSFSAERSNLVALCYHDAAQLRLNATETRSQVNLRVREGEAGPYAPSAGFVAPQPAEAQFPSCRTVSAPLPRGEY